MSGLKRRNFDILNFFKEINLFIQVSNTINRNTKSKVIKILGDDAASRLIEKMIGSGLIHFIMKKCLEYLIF